MLYYEDFAEGRVFDLGPYLVTREEVIAFAREFDPQPFHLDEAAAKSSVLGGLSASGWHNCAILMRMICDGYLNNSASLGSSGISEVKWQKPVFAGETVRGRMTVVSRRLSQSRPDRGIVQCRWELIGPEGQTKVDETGMHFIAVRGA